MGSRYGDRSLVGVLAVQITREQREQAKREAAAAGLSVAAWARQRLFGEEPDASDGRTRRWWVQEGGDADQ